MNLLLVFLPISFFLHFNKYPDGWKFWASFLAMVPLAQILGDATEELAMVLNSDVIGGLLNATFGNAVEMILTVQTLRAGLIQVVKATLLGSVLSNLLLVLGMSFFFGGIMKAPGSAAGKAAMKKSVSRLTQGAEGPNI